MLGDGCTGGCGDESCGSGNVEGMGGIATGPDDVNEVGVVRRFDTRAQLAHHLCGGGDLADGFALGAQAGDDGGCHGGRNLARHDQAHQVQHLVGKDFPVFDDALQGFLGGDHAPGNGATGGACSMATPTYTR
jgi:hypothetical protein